MSTKITVRTNGSIRVEGDFELYDIDGHRFDLQGRQKIALCRCGQSNDIPFCDGTHKKNGFTSQVNARTLPPEA